MQHPNVIYRVVGLHCAHFCIAAKPICHHGGVDEERIGRRVSSVCTCSNMFIMAQVLFCHGPSRSCVRAKVSLRMGHEACRGSAARVTTHAPM